jgi:hypothetical protein
VATATTFCAATTCFVTKFYDQSGNTRDISQATAGNQPQIFLSSGPSAGYPYVSFTAGSMALTSASNFTPTTGVLSFSAVANRASGTGAGKMMRGGSPNEFDVKSASANNWAIIGGTSGSVTGAATDATWHAGSALLNGASSVIGIDNTDTTGTATGSGGAGAWGMTGANSTTMKIVESGFWYNITFTAQNRTDLSAQQHSAWGF